MIDSMALAPEGDMKEQVARDLYQTLADVYVMSFRAQGAHWNVTGKDFHEFHGFFAMVYGDVYGSVDAIAENIRKVGFDAPFTLENMCDATKIDTVNGGNDPIALTAALKDANAILIEDLLTLFASSTAANEQAIADFAAARLDMHQKWAWQMGAILGGK